MGAAAPLLHLNTSTPGLLSVTEIKKMPKPVLQAMVLADHVYRDADTGKFLIIGTFGNIVVRRPNSTSVNAQDQPALADGGIEGGGSGGATKDVRQAGSPYLYVALTGLHGAVELRIRYVDLSDFTLLFEGQLDVASADPLALAEFSVPLPPLPVRLPMKPGQYSLDILHDGEILGAWRVGVKFLEQLDAGEEQDQ